MKGPREGNNKVSSREIRYEEINAMTQAKIRIQYQICEDMVIHYPRI